MESLYRSLEQRARKHPTFWEFIEKVNAHYLNERMRVFGKDEHAEELIRAKNGIYDLAPSIFLRIHRELGYHVGIPPEPERRKDIPTALQTLRVNSKHADELAEEIARALVAAEKNWWGVPFWKAPEQDVVSLIKSKALEMHRKKRGQLLIGPANV
ncbi:MAG: hypothetical protein GXN93_00315 [Candidatus Diapherotrites archaeon]|nr:hypothetical protein [Candidatus Diapherotrites archaeon]